MAQRLARAGVDRSAVVVEADLGALGNLGPADDEPVDDRLDGVALVLVERDGLGEIEEGAVDADADEALPPDLVEDPVTFGLAVADERCEHEQASALWQPEDLVDDLLDRLALDLVPERAVRVADPRVEQTEVVVDLGDRADR